MTKLDQKLPQIHVKLKEFRFFAACPKQTIFGPNFNRFFILFSLKEQFPKVSQFYTYAKIPRILSLELNDCPKQKNHYSKEVNRVEIKFHH